MIWQSEFADIFFCSFLFFAKYTNQLNKQFFEQIRLVCTLWGARCRSAFVASTTTSKSAAYITMDSNILWTDILRIIILILCRLFIAYTSALKLTLSDNYRLCFHPTICYCVWVWKVSLLSFIRSLLDQKSPNCPKKSLVKYRKYPLI